MTRQYKIKGRPILTRLIQLHYRLPSALLDATHNDVLERFNILLYLNQFWRCFLFLIEPSAFSFGPIARKENANVKMRNFSIKN